MKRRLIYDGVVYEEVEAIDTTSAGTPAAEPVIATDDLILVATRNLMLDREIKAGEPIPAAAVFESSPRAVEVFLPEASPAESLVRDRFAKWVRRAGVGG